MATCIHGTHWDGVSVFWCPQCATVASQSVAPFTFAIALSPDDKDMQIVTLRGEVERMREALQFYADDGTHAPPGHSAEGWCRDSGHRARLALGLPSKDE
ncbi:MAG: hypothetical protein OK454_03815 [Thaumarchaeota archaeon]|nr:hypothetical protein [Nitrososphaerota archaeon]